MDTKRMRSCASRLPPPGDEVVVQCLDEIERLSAQLAEAIEDIESWGAYADDYFKQKWDLAGCVERHKKALTPNVGAKLETAAPAQN